MRTLAALLAVSTVAACDGLDDVSGSGAGAGGSVEILRIFSDGSGIFRLESEAEGEEITATGYASDVSGVSADNPPAVVDLAEISFDGSNAYGNFYSGTTTINGTQVEVLAYQDFGGNVEIFYATDGVEAAAFTGGLSVSNIPSGTYVYNGTNIISIPGENFSEDGTFAMTANFTNGTGEISGSTVDTTISANDIQIDTTTGEFRTNNLTLTDSFYSLNTDGSLYGTFHGDGAVGVTGMYHDNQANPDYIGAIAGTR